MRPLILFLPLAIAGFFACTEAKEGCLDIEATNFDASADKNCCCTYPNLKLTVSQRFDDKLWVADSTYVNNLGLPFRLKSAVFYVSDFQLSRNSETFTVADSVQLRTLLSGSTDTIARYFTDDFLLLRRSTTEYTVGQFKHSGLFDQFSCRLGLDAAARTILPSSAPTDHPLRPQAENLWLGNDTSFVSMRLIVQPDTSNHTALDTLYFSHFDFDNFLIQESGTFQQETGYDLKLILTLNYLELFRDVDWQNHNLNAWKNRIVANLPNVFTVSQ